MIFFLVNKKKFDVIFIDGLHEYDQVRRDIINSIRDLKEGGWIVLHDMLPRNWIEGHVPALSPNFWTGDVWKIAFELINTKGIVFKIAKIDFGVGVMKINKSFEGIANLQDELRSKQFEYLFNNIAKLPIEEWENIIRWINEKDS